MKKIIARVLLVGLFLFVVTLNQFSQSVDAVASPTQVGAGGSSLLEAVLTNINPGWIETILWEPDTGLDTTDILTPLASNLDETITYSVTINTYEGEEVFIDNVQITVFDQLITTQPVNAEICQDGVAEFSVELDSELTIPISYQWQLSNSTNPIDFYDLPSTTTYFVGVDDPQLQVIGTFGTIHEYLYYRCKISDENEINTYYSDIVNISYTLSPTANAGNDATICESETYSINDATASNYDTLAWTTSGDGTFSDSTIIHPVYTPGSVDISNDSVTLSLTAYATYPCSDSVFHQMTLTIQKLPGVDAGSNSTICKNETFTPDDASASNDSSIFWTSSGDGEFSDNGTLFPEYTPGNMDTINGSVNLTLTAYPFSPCSDSVYHQMTLTIQKLPGVDAGSDSTICANQTFTPDSAVASNYSSILWTSSGDGTFSDSTFIHPTYFPGSQDTVIGSVTLSLTAEQVNPCSSSDVFSDEMELFFQKLPGAFAGPGDTICESDTYSINDATASNYDTLAWTTSGDGTFSDSTIIHPVYTPGSVDISNDSVTLSLTAYAVDPCSEDATHSMVLSFQNLPLASAGSNDTICKDETFTPGNASAFNNDSIKWTSSGDGQFEGNGTLFPVYTPGNTDTINGTVDLTLTAYPSSPCTDSVFNQMTLTIQKLPGVFAGSDTTICKNDVFTPDNAMVSNYSSIIWTSSGDGTFSDSTFIHPTYFPGSQDTVIGSVTLSLTAEQVNPCSSSDVFSDDMELFFQKLPGAYAGLDVTICESDIFGPINDADTSNCLQVKWTSNGDGEFDYDTIISPVYIPGSADIDSGSVELYLMAYSISPCLNNTIDTLNLSIINTPAPTAGGDATICENDPYQLSGQVICSEEFNWSTSGDGAFSDSYILDPIYTPGSEDIENGQVELALTAFGTNDSTNSITLTINPAPHAPISGIESLCANSHWIEYTADTKNFDYAWSVENGTKVDSLSSGNVYVINWANMPLETGTVKLITEDKITGCAVDNLLSVLFSEYSAPDPTNIIEKPRRENGVPVVLICTDSGHIYQWYKEFEPINGATRQFYYPGATNDFIEPNLSYQVLVENEFKCSTMSYNYTYEPNKSQLFEPLELFIVYPNPSNGSFTLELNEDIVPEDIGSFTYTITDLAGKLKVKSEASGRHYQFNINNLQKGVYLLHVDIPQYSSQFKKLVIK